MIQPQENSEDLLRTIAEGTASVTGDEFFHALVQHLAHALDVVMPLSPSALG